MAAEYHERIPQLRAAATAWTSARQWLADTADMLRDGQNQLVEHWPDTSGTEFVEKLSPTITSIRSWAGRYVPSGIAGTITDSDVVRHIEALIAGLETTFPRVEAVWKNYDDYMRNYESYPYKRDINWYVAVLNEMTDATESLEPLFKAVETAMKAAVGSPWAGPIGGGGSLGGGGGSGLGGGLGSGAGGVGGDVGGPGDVEAPAPEDIGDPEQFEPDDIGSPASTEDAGSGGGGGTDTQDGQSQNIPSPGDIDAGAYDPVYQDPAYSPGDLGGSPSFAGGSIGGAGGLSALASPGIPLSTGPHDASMTPPVPSAATGAGGTAGSRAMASGMPGMYPPTTQGANPRGGGKPGGVKPGAAAQSNGYKARKPAGAPGVALTGRATPGIVQPGRGRPVKGIQPAAVPAPSDDQVLDDELWQVHRPDRTPDHHAGN
ncbi:hypothetical protein ACQEVZ_45660 [Dactylosporangium sp. CA-152071]|uniref:hypothetical protein n=1 Tax=Dactylosporangium sp. CA-152071 TaxID=3239933 RepID=UPI003D90B23A